MYSGSAATLFHQRRNGERSAATFSLVFWRYALPLLITAEKIYFWVSKFLLELEMSQGRIHGGRGGRLPPPRAQKKEKTGKKKKKRMKKKGKREEKDEKEEIREQ